MFPIVGRCFLSEELKYLDFARIDFEMSKIQVSIFRYLAFNIVGIYVDAQPIWVDLKIFLLIVAPTGPFGPANILSRAGFMPVPLL